jgi:hypothetical protein
MVSDPIRSDGLSEEYLDGEGIQKECGWELAVKPGWRWIASKDPENETDSINEKGLGGDRRCEREMGLGSVVVVSESVCL